MLYQPPYAQEDVVDVEFVKCVAVSALVVALLVVDVVLAFGSTCTVVV
jgi:hypothetical protein